MGSVSIPHGLGCYDGQRRGALTNYQCDKWYALSGGSSRTCMGDGNWDGEVPECSEFKTVLYYDVTVTITTCRTKQCEYCSSGDQHTNVGVVNFLDCDCCFCCQKGVTLQI